MTKRTARALAAAALASSFLLTSCGGDDEPESDKIEDANGGDKPSASASPSEETEAGAPTFDLPSDVKVDFEDFEDSDPVKNAVLRDATYAITSIAEQGASDSERQTPNMKRYFAGLEGAQLTDSLIEYTKSGKRLTGTLDYYKPAVELRGKSKAVVTYCEDERKAYDKNAETGKVNVTTPSTDDFGKWSMVLQTAKSGDWQVFRATESVGEQECVIG